MKTNKSYTKRLKIRKSGKVQARKPGQNHFNAKESSSEKFSKNRASTEKLIAKVIHKYVPFK